MLAKALAEDRKSDGQEDMVEALQSNAEVVQLYRSPAMSETAAATLLKNVQAKVGEHVIAIQAEQCYNVALSNPLTLEEARTLLWLLQETFEPEKLSGHTKLKESGSSTVVEVGPRLSFSTAFSTNAVSICHSCGLHKIMRLERSMRFRIETTGTKLSEAGVAQFAAMVHDRMTQTVYDRPLSSFKTNKVPDPVITIPVLEGGREVLEKLNKEMGLAFDDWDLDYYTAMFQNELKRDPTNVELFDIAQSNSEHSRHWFFRAQLIIDGEPAPQTLIDMVMETLERASHNSVIGFKDNSSAIRGFKTTPLFPVSPGGPSSLDLVERDLDLLFTAETHNFPCAVAPYPGSETGAGGRIRDTHATGIGSLVLASTAGYCVGNLKLEGAVENWENPEFVYPGNLAPPIQILIDASNGASDYGNKFGEPLIQGYCRTFGMRSANGERREWLKPIMFSAGIGQIDHRHLEKEDPEVGMLVVKIGGPAYRIGMGGGAASSMASGSNDAELDFNAVQRGDAEMAQKLYRTVRACVEMGEDNPIVSIHDQGAGGNCNCVKEIVYPAGGEIDIRKVEVGDETLSVLEIWGAEYQENDCLLVRPEKEHVLREVATRERCIMTVIGHVTGTGRIVVKDSRALAGSPTPEDLDLDKVLGKMPQKTYRFERQSPQLVPFNFPDGETIDSALKQVLRLPGVCSKRFLTTKVDRSVTGLVAQQQCVGPLLLPLADCAVIAQSHQTFTGGACAIGEQPIKGLISAAAMARMSVGESITNLCFVKSTGLNDMKASGNWMYAAKLDGEGAHLYDAAVALKSVLLELGVAIDGGKDSLSMAATAGDEVVKAPGTLVMSCYVTVPDVTKKVTPALQLPGEGKLLLVDLACGRRRLGGSSLAQVYEQVGSESPDMEDVHVFKGAYETMMNLLDAGKVTAGHDVSDGGYITCLLEMAFAGNTGIRAMLPMASDGEGGELAALFAEELGLVLEVSGNNMEEVISAFEERGVPCKCIGEVTADSEILVGVEQSDSVVTGSLASWRAVWEETAFRLEKLQASEPTVEAEQSMQATREAPVWKVPFTPQYTAAEKLKSASKPRVAILREEGSNGDREMAAAFYAAGCEPWDLTMSDLLAGRALLKDFQGLVFVGGFSYADVMDSAKGWAGSIRQSPQLLSQFDEFYHRPDTFSLGICNGCQLMALLGWVPGDIKGDRLKDMEQPRFIHNKSGRFESRYVPIKIEESPAVMLKGMEGTVMGVWCAHGEGLAYFPNPSVFEEVVQGGMIPIRYCDASGAPTETYPYNPNGSPLGIAGLCSPDGRHLAMMPHPERSYLAWQTPWAPASAVLDPYGPTPWLKMFQNAREWCESRVD